MAKENSKWNEINFHVPIEVIQESIKNSNIAEGYEKGKFMIRGVAINSTLTRNGVFYPEEELKKSAKTLRNKPVLKDHEALIDNIVGRTTTRCSYNDTARCIEFEAQIMDKKMQEMLDDGRITNVSIGAMVEELVEESGDGDDIYLRAEGIEFLELSLVPVPGDANATIGQALCEAYKKKAEVTKEIDSIEVKEEINMAEDEKPVEPVEPVLEEPKKEAEELEEVSEEPAKEEEVSEEEVAPEEEPKKEDSEENVSKVSDESDEEEGDVSVPVEDAEDEEEEEVVAPEENKKEEEVSKMAEEKLKAMEAENAKLKEQLDSIAKADYDKVVSEYTALAEELKVESVATENLPKEAVEALTKNLNSMKEKLTVEVPKAKGKVLSAEDEDEEKAEEDFSGYALVKEGGKLAFFKE